MHFVYVHSAPVSFKTKAIDYVIYTLTRGGIATRNTDNTSRDHLFLRLHCLQPQIGADRYGSSSVVIQVIIIIFVN